MAIDAFLQSAGAILVGMALLSILETLLPYVRKPDWRRRHRAPNLALVALTLSLNFAFNAGAVLVSVWLAERGFGLLAGAALPPLAMILLGILVLDGSTYACHRLLHAAAAALERPPRPPLGPARRRHDDHPPAPHRGALAVPLHHGAGLGARRSARGGRALSRDQRPGRAHRAHEREALGASRPRALAGWWCTPNMHKVHHSRPPIETDSNYGNILSAVRPGSSGPSRRPPPRAASTTGSRATTTPSRSGSARCCACPCAGSGGGSLGSASHPGYPVVQRGGGDERELSRTVPRIRLVCDELEREIARGSAQTAYAKLADEPDAVVAEVLGRMLPPHALRILERFPEPRREAVLAQVPEVAAPPVGDQRPLSRPERRPPDGAPRSASSRRRRASATRSKGCAKPSRPPSSRTSTSPMPKTG